MALTRARIVAAPAELKRVLRQDLDTILDGHLRAEPAPRAILLKDACAMRARLARDLPASSVWDVKRRLGGLIDVEFIAQIYQLIGANSAVRDVSTRLALGRLEKAGLLSAEDAQFLKQAELFWRQLQAVLRLLCGATPPVDLERDLAPASLNVLLRAMKLETLPDLIEKANILARDVHAVFVRLVGPVA